MRYVLSFLPVENLGSEAYTSLKFLKDQKYVWDNLDQPWVLRMFFFWRTPPKFHSFMTYTNSLRLGSKMTFIILLLKMLDYLVA